MFRPEQGSALWRVLFLSMITNYNVKSKEVVKNESMKSYDSQDVWIEKCKENIESFAGFIQVFFEKTATMLRITAVVAYPLHTILLNVLAR